MCGIVGYIGKQSAAPIILEGLRRLEYRGYDSAGMAIIEAGELAIRKKKGKIDEGLARLLQEQPVHGSLGIGHTRWATHGQPSDENSHPHLDQSGKIAVVHNGVIENYDRLKERQLKAGHSFHSSTDTEVLAHLVGEHYANLKKETDDSLHPLAQAVTAALREVIGTYGVAVVCSDYPDVIIGARRGSPLIVGIGEGEHFLASDANAIAPHTRQVVYLNDYDVVTLSRERFTVSSLGTDTAQVQISQLEFSAEAAERGEFAHFMLKEIFEQPRTVENALRGRVDLEEGTAKFGGLNLSSAELRAIDQIVITACGTSWHAALVGEYLLEEFAHIPVEVEYASEFRYRNAPIEKNTLVLAITQSGETADTLASLRETKRRGHTVLALCNVVGSTIAREADGGIYLHAGPEIGVASTKAFTSQVTVLTLLALLMGRIRMLSLNRGRQIIQGLEAIPGQMEQILKHNDAIAKLAKKYATAKNFFFLGRQYNFPVALEGALKLKEISYIHAEGYPAAEMKHGPIALIDEHTPSVVVIPNDAMYDKTLSNLEVVKARKGPVIAITTEGNTTLAGKVDDIIYVPATLECLFPLLAVMPLQLLSYHVAVARGCDVDKPRNLAKSVTVE
ncbi:MAG TPA: glutamine--fructose-6-phosphate transaminase (isomerizing) [Verrucomicrobiae bacterium]|jgi:glucosamine--fructose-6-phosphate aminotransferase (isomerizing)|nr:glutamine--fructose-6-phosphate transaminase (isomerizing) [Verrucomicrobiae bacterium]